MPRRANSFPNGRAVMEFCWKNIGIYGDRSCPMLKEHSHCRDCAVFAQQGRALLNRAAPGNYLEEWVALLSQERTAVRRDLNTAQVFRLKSEWLAFPARCWMEIVVVRPVRHIPHRSNRVFLGIVSVRGEIHLCVSLSDLLSIENDESVMNGNVRRASPRFCVVKQDKVPWVFPVDEVHGLVSYAEKDIETIPSTLAKSFQRYSRGLLTVSEKKVALLDEAAVFDAFSRSVQ
jgi:chemotaxis-related protein WspD